MPAGGRFVGFSTELQLTVVYAYIHNAMLRESGNSLFEGMPLIHVALKNLHGTREIERVYAGLYSGEIVQPTSEKA